MNTTTRFLLTVLFFFSLIQVCLADAAALISVYNRPGEYPSPDGSCKAVLEVNAMGGFLTLQVGGKNNPKVDDITGLAWLDDDLLVYTVSPIYGIPGLYLFDCSNYVTARLVPPHNSSYTSPEDKDYFELFGVEKNRAFTIRYYYSSDVSKTDFSAFRARENLKTFMLDMTGGPALIRSH